MDEKSLGKLLHLAKFHGWQPERLAGDWPSQSWDTEIIMPHVAPYMAGSVGNSDALNLARGLDVALQSEAAGLDQALYFAALGLLQIARDGAFQVNVEFES